MPSLNEITQAMMQSYECRPLFASRAGGEVALDRLAVQMRKIITMRMSLAYAAGRSTAELTTVLQDLSRAEQNLDECRVDMAMRYFDLAMAGTR